MLAAIEAQISVSSSFPHPKASAKAEATINRTAAPINAVIAAA